MTGTLLVDASRATAGRRKSRTGAGRQPRLHRAGTLFERRSTAPAPATDLVRVRDPTRICIWAVSGCVASVTDVSGQTILDRDKGGRVMRCNRGGSRAPALAGRAVEPTLMRVGTSSRAAYARAFNARHNTPERPSLEGPAMYGAPPTEDGSPARLLITDDLAHDELVNLLPNLRAGRIDVFTDASRCRDLIERELGWVSKPSTAMACVDLQVVPDRALTGDLTLRPVRRLGDDAADGVPLNEAVAVAMSADTTIDEPAAVLTRYLRSLPRAFQLFCAVDGDGAARATSGIGVFGPEATVLFVNTAPDWRRRGIGRSMTALALHAARGAGAQSASLDASEAGSSIYQRLGFQTVARTLRFSSPAY